MNKYNIFVLLMSLTLSSCALVTHTEEVLTLKGLADEQDDMAKYVEKRDQQFDKMLRVFSSEDMPQYQTKKSIIKEFGEPIYQKDVVFNDNNASELLYRYQTRFFGTEKIYLYFDEEEKLLDWKIDKTKES